MGWARGLLPRYNRLQQSTWFASIPSAAEPPKEPLDKGVAVITGNTVETIVKDPTKASWALFLSAACSCRLERVG